MKKKREYQVLSGKDSLNNKPLQGAQLVEATALNLLITAALTRSSLLELSELLPFEARQCNSGIHAMVELMQFASSEMGILPILSLSALAKTYRFSFQGSLTISSDDFGIALALDDCELSVQAEPMIPNTDD